MIDEKYSPQAEMLMKNTIENFEEDLKEVKPIPEGIFKSLELLNGDPKQSYYIGDHQRDIETAHNAGVISIACTYGYHETDPINWNADHLVQKPSDIMEIV